MSREISLEEGTELFEKLGLFDRRKALGKEADEVLTEIEILEGSKTPEARNKYKPKKNMVCVYCGEKSIYEEFKYIHTCQKPMIGEQEKWPMPSRPIMTYIYTVKLLMQSFHFADYESALLFRRLIYIEARPISEVITNPELNWAPTRFPSSFVPKKEEEEIKK